MLFINIMKNIDKIKHYFKKYHTKKIKKEKDKILQYLYELKHIEANLWGVNIVNLKNGEEETLEDTNHLIYLIANRDQKNLTKILKLKSTKDFFDNLNNIRNDFKILKRKILKKDKLKLLISNFTIKLVDFKNYNKFKEVFLYERMLYEVLDKQDEDFATLMKDISNMKINPNEDKIEIFVDSLKKIRNILSGHIEFCELFEDERNGYSNVSNIILGLIKIFETDIE